ncbi:MAG TPA: 4-(cytidine 5'-diphospho)-2-C-methyl-D-erythritol kinase [Rhizomicrobium sp.]|nr:4-(cytidine 5'-diphospho)-2-C-methyl-D-erythritol kinase [Rhizomicrobium sp.]
MAIRPEAVRVFAPAKINLFLHVVGKRGDGYHNLQSLVAFADAGDVLALERSREFALVIDGPFAEGLAGENNNLVLKAAHRLAESIGVREALRVTLTKNLPVASGIGGGSADAAAAMRGALALWGRQDANVMDIAAGIGSDVPVCLRSATALMEGRGETVTALPELPPLAIVLANPGISVSTAAVFKRIAIGETRKLEPLAHAPSSAAELAAYLHATCNDLEPAALSLEPLIGDVLHALRGQGAVLARMSGSGATCFGLFETQDQADSAAARIASQNLRWWVRATKFAAAAVAKPQ